jgi:hypothetical protein
MNHLEVVKVLLQDDRVKATPKFNSVISKAQSNDWLEMASILISDSRTSEYWKMSTAKSAKRRLCKAVKNLGGLNTQPVTANPIFEIEPDVENVDLSELTCSTTAESK